MLRYFCFFSLFVYLNHCLFYYHIRSCLYELHSRENMAIKFSKVVPLLSVASSASGNYFDIKAD